MKLKNRYLIFSVFVIGVSVSVFTGCKKDEEPSSVVVKTLPVTDNEGDKVTFNAALEGVTTGVNGFVYSTSSGPTLENAIQVHAGAPVNDTITAHHFIDPITPAYYVRAYAYVDDEMYYGNEVSFATGYAIGQAYGGGKIAYILQPGDPGYDVNAQHGLIIANEFFGLDILWGCEETNISGADGTEIGTGAANSLSIVEQCGEAYSAATLCDTYESDGFTDWYLPSYSELEAIDGNFDEIGGISGGYYWSSSQSSELKAWAIYLWTNEVDGGVPGAYLKNYERRAIAVRSF